MEICFYTFLLGKIQIDIGTQKGWVKRDEVFWPMSKMTIYDHDHDHMSWTSVVQKCDKRGVQNDFEKISKKLNDCLDV